MSFLPPFAQVQVSINSGANVTGGQDNVPSAATVAFTGVNTTLWTNVLWEIYDYPAGWSTPAGWTLQATGIITYNGTQASPNPPSFTLPANTTLWGKWAVRATVNLGIDPTGALNLARMQDSSCALSMLSPNGVHDSFAGETTQFGGAFRQWVSDLKKNWRLLDGAVGQGGFTESRITTTPITTSGPAPFPWVDVSATGTNGPAAVILGAGTQRARVKNWKGNAAVSPITVTAPAGVTIESPTAPQTFAATAVINVTGATYEWQLDSTGTLLGLV